MGYAPAVMSRVPWKQLAAVVVGAVGGFAYYQLWGCDSG